MLLVCLCGRKSSGKDSASDALVAKYGDQIHSLAIADGPRLFVERLTEIDPAYLTATHLKDTADLGKLFIPRTEPGVIDRVNVTHPDTCVFRHADGILCGYPADAHPTSYVADGDPYEAALPDSGAIYDHVIEASSGAAL